MRAHRSITVHLKMAGAAALLTSATLLAPGFAAEPAVAKPPEQTKPPEDSPLPLVVRVDKSAITPYTDVSRDDVRPVDKWVLGAHAVGQSRTEGESRAELIPDSTEASFDVVYRGRTATNTTGTSGPAVVYSRTFTDFVVKQRVVFEPRQGFMLQGDAVIEGNTKLVYDRFASKRNLGRRIITAVAQRQAGRMREQARQIADRDNKKEVKDEFVKEVRRQVDAANQGLDIVRYVNEFLGEDSELQLHAKSSRDFIYLGVGPKSEKYAPMTELPRPREKPSQIEIWVHSSIVGEPVALALKALTPNMPIPLLAQTKVLGALSAPLAGIEGIGVDFRNDWLVLSLPDQQPPPSDSVGKVASGPAGGAEKIK